MNEDRVNNRPYFPHHLCISPQGIALAVAIGLAPVIRQAIQQARDEEGCHEFFGALHALDDADAPT